MKTLLCLPVIALLGCASAPPAPQQVAQNDKKMVCHREQPAGLLRMVTVCREVAHVQDMEKSAKEFMENRREGKWNE